jgi:O-antigen ligase
MIPKSRINSGLPNSLGFTALLALLLVVPWLWPLTAGPSPNLIPLLASWGCLLVTASLLAMQHDPRGVLRVAMPAAWIAAASLSALIGLAQWFGITPDTRLISPAEVGQAYGNLRQRNQFASLMSLGLAALVWTVNPKRYLITMAGAVLLAAAAAATASRTGLLQWLMLAALAAIWPGPKRERLLVCACALAGYAFASWLLPALLLHWRGVEAANVLVRATADVGCSSRRVLWDNVMFLIAQRPWIGWGIGELDYAHYVTLYPGERFCDILDNAHNLPLHVAVELGVPLAAAAVLVVGAAVWHARPWRESDPSRQLSWAALAIIGLHSLLEYPLWYGPFQLALVSAAGALGLPSSPVRVGARVVIALASMALLASLAWLWARYDLVSDAYRRPEERRVWTRADPVGVLGDMFPFHAQMRFAELALTPLTRANAEYVHALALELLHYSPEPSVIEKLIDSAVLLARDQEAADHALRYKSAFPDRYEAWRAARGLPPSAATGAARRYDVGEQLEASDGAMASGRPRGP